MTEKRRNEKYLKLSKIGPSFLRGKGANQKLENNGGKVYTIDREGLVRGLEIVTPKRTYVLPWNHFLRAEGNNGEIVAKFSTDDVVIKGKLLDVLLHEFAQQRISALRQLTRAERMELSKEGPDIEEIIVTPAGETKQ